ncbi:hypothetical protein CPL00221_CDS0028 [Escherichia phage RobRod40]
MRLYTSSYIGYAYAIARIAKDIPQRRLYYYHIETKQLNKECKMTNLINNSIALVAGTAVTGFFVWVLLLASNFGGF